MCLYTCHQVFFSSPRIWKISQTETKSREREVLTEKKALFSSPTVAARAREKRLLLFQSVVDVVGRKEYSVSASM